MRATPSGLADSDGDIEAVPRCSLQKTPAAAPIASSRSAALVAVSHRSDRPRTRCVMSFPLPEPLTGGPLDLRNGVVQLLQRVGVPGFDFQIASLLADDVEK